MGNSPTNYPFGDLYDAQTGEYPSSDPFRARPVVGGHFALLALENAPSAAAAKRNENFVHGGTGPSRIGKSFVG